MNEEVNEWRAHAKKNVNVCCGVKEWCVRQQLWRWTQREKQPVWRPGCILQGTDWNVTHGMACATVTSFGSFSAGGAEAVCRCSLPASHTTPHRDYDHIMQMTVPSVHSSLMLACSLFVFWHFFESSRLQRVWLCSHVLTRLKVIGILALTNTQEYITLFRVRCAGWPWNELSEVSWSSQQSKSLELEMFTGWDLYHFVGFGCTLTHIRWFILDQVFQSWISAAVSWWGLT